ncbi:EamA family transporter RarD [Nannocystaceae bacterium ST9]
MPPVPTNEASSESRRGLVYGIAAYGLWGVVPLFWKLLADVDPLEVLAHRVVWGALTFAVIVALADAGGSLKAALADRRTLAVMALSGTLLAINWGTFILAVSTDRLLDASLGYFINPLVSVALGTIVLREGLRRAQWLAIAAAVCGVALLGWQVGRVPWISLVLALSFGSYGLVRKTAKVDSLIGSTIESALLVPVALVYLAIVATRGIGQVGNTDLLGHVLLVATGVVTAGPLLLFTSAARRLPLSTIGFLQYMTPSMQFVIAVFLFAEPITGAQLVAFGFIWLGLLLFSFDLWRSASRPIGLD